MWQRCGTWEMLSGHGANELGLGILVIPSKLNDSIIL